jgi:O-antigen/teichoic acid export membrane protein
MGIVFRQSALNTLILFAGILIGFVNEFLLLRNILEADQVGLIKLLIQVSALLAQFAALGGANTLLRYFPTFRDRESRHGGILFGMLAVGSVGFLLAGLLLLGFQPAIEARFSERSPLFSDYFYLLYPLIWCTINFVLLEAYAKSNYRTVASTALYEVVLRVFVMLSITAYALQWISVHQFYLVFTAVNCSISFLMAFWLAWNKDLLLRPSLAFFRGSRFRGMMGFGLLSLLSDFSARLFTSIDSIMIGDRIGLAAVAIYVTGSYLCSVMMAPGRALIRIASPLVADFWKRDDRQQMNKLFEQVATNSLVLSAWLYLLVWSGSPALFTLIPPEFAPAIAVFAVLGAGRVFDMVTGLSGVILGTSSHYRFIAVFNAFSAVLAVGSNLLLIPRYGIAGASWATTLTILVSNSLRMAYLYRHYGFFPFSMRSLYILMAGLAAWGAWQAMIWLGLASGSVWVQSALSMVLVSAVFMGSVMAFRLSPEIDEKLSAWRSGGSR